ncbi:MAG: alpha/beta hydrolase-fold protein [Gammaproteobacteria bacterium]
MMTHLTRTLLLLFFVNLSSTTLAQQDSTPITIGQHLSISSTLLDEERGLNVWLPRTYGSSNEHYPVLYLLDGSAHFHTATAIVNFLSINQMIPEMIVVGIDNTDRNRDLTPPSQNEVEVMRLPTHGGADKFQTFIAQELMPWVEETYRTHPYRILVGHSFGGLFAINTIVTNPTLFDAYIAISPSLQWNDQGLSEQADSYFENIDVLPISLFMTAGNEGNQLLGGVRKLAGVLDEKAPQDFQWQFKHMPLETHGSVPLRSIHEGLEFVFSNWDLRNPIETYNQFGIEAIENFYAVGDRRYKFERGIPINSFASVLFNLVQQSRFDQALAMLDKSISTLNPPAAMLVYVADMLNANDRRTDSIRIYRATLARNPGNQRARAVLDEWDVDYADLIPSVVLDNEILERYIGEYDLQLDAPIKVVLEDGILLREYNGSRYALHPINDAQFYIAESDLIYQFIVTKDGEVTGVDIDQSGTPIYASRL